MIFSSTPFATQPFATTDLDNSVPSPFKALIQDQEAPRAYLLVARPYDPVTEAEVEVRASIGLTSGGYFPILDGRDWPANLSSAADTQVDLLGDEIDSLGRTSFGSMKFMVGDKEHDKLLQYFWDGRDVEVLMGSPDFSLAEYERVIFGTASDARFDDKELEIVFRGREELLDVPVQTTLYAGTGGLEGGSDIAGLEKPRTFGEVPNFSPVLVDRPNQIYQANDGAIHAVAGAYDGAAALTYAGDVVDITATTVNPGEYKTQLSGGYIRLGAEPVKAFTVDVQGDNVGGYVSSTADIARQVIERYSVLTADDLDLPSFDAMNVDNSAPVGIALSTESVKQVITDLVQGIAGAWTINRQGKITVAVFKFSTPAGVITDDFIVKGTFKRVKSLIPSWRRKLGYAKAWTVQKQDALVATATDARKDFVAQEYRYSISEDAGIKTVRKLATSVEKNTYLANKSDADTEVAREQTLFSANLDRFDFTAKLQQFKYSVGQTVTLHHHRYGILSDVVIIGLRENTSTRETTFRVIGKEVLTGDFTGEFTGEFS